MIAKPMHLKYLIVKSPIIAMSAMRKYHRVLSARHWRLPQFSFVRKEVVQMRDYEILIVVFTVIAIIVSILIEYIKK